MSFLAPIAGGLISGAVGSALLGGSDDKAEKAVRPRILGFRAGDMALTKRDDVITLRSGKQNRAAVKGIQKAFGSAGAQYAALAGKIKPGFGLLTRALAREINTRRLSARSDLRDQFARRRLSGSSFAADTLSRNEAEFADLEKKARAEAFVEEMKMTQTNIANMATARANAYQTLLTQLNFEAEMGAKLAVSGQDTLAGLAKAQAEMFGNSGDRQESIWAPFITAVGN